MSDMTDAGQSLSSETVRSDRGQILECLEFGGGEPLTKNGHIIFLSGTLASNLPSNRSLK